MPGLERRTLSEAEFNAIKDRVLNEAPDGLDEASFMRWAGPRLDGAVAEAEFSPEPTKGGAVGRFVGNAASMLNPVEMVKGVYGAVTSPIETGKAMYGRQKEQFGKAGDAFSEGRYSEAAGYTGAGLLPLLGPVAADVGEQAGRGDVAGAAGATAGLLAPMGAVPAAKAAARTGVVKRAIPALREGALSRIADVNTPKVGPNKQRFAGKASRSAPVVADAIMEEGAPWTREGLRKLIEERTAAAGRGLDEASDARLSASTFQTDDVVAGLRGKLDDLTSKAVEADRLDPERWSDGAAREGVPVGQDVIPGPSQPRAAQIQQALEEVQQLGPVARYEPLRRIRQSYDGPAEAVYNPSITQDFLKAQGGKRGAADVTDVLRQKLSEVDPATAAANKSYSQWKNADDASAAVAETEAARPRVGRQRVLGAILGGAAAGPGGAIAGALASPAIEAVLSKGPTTKLQTARLQIKLSNVIKKAQSGRPLTTIELSMLRRLAPGMSMAVSHAQEQEP
jgi:hypothetical protein